MEDIPNRGRFILPLNPKNSIKELCVEDKLKLGQLIRGIAIENASKKKIGEKLMQESQDLDEELEMLAKEKEKLLKESEELQESLTNSSVQIEFIQNTPNLSLSFPADSKTMTPEPSITSISKDISINASIQTSCDKEIQISDEKNSFTSFTRKKTFETRDDVKKVLEKALETSSRIQKIFGSSYNSIDDTFKDSKSHSCLCSKSIHTEPEAPLIEQEEIIVIEEPFYDSHLIDVINQMEEFE